MTLALFISAPSASAQNPFKPPIVDLTTSLGTLNPDGTVEVQTHTVVDPGRPIPAATSACAESLTRNAGATCVNVCVRIPPGSKLTNVRTIAAEHGKPGGPCGGRYCLGQPLSVAKAMFEATGYTKDQDFGYDRVCWVFRNWHPTNLRAVWLIAAYKPPPPEAYREIAEAYLWKRLQKVLDPYTGPAPVDCGQHRDPGWVKSIDKLKELAALKESLECALRAAQGKTPFWTAKESQGIDTTSYHGLLGQRDGSFHIFTQCFGCSPEFSLRWCLEPVIETDARGNSKFGCARWR